MTRCMELQAVGQKLDAALNSPVAVAEGPEHGGGVSAQGNMGSGRVSDLWGRGPSAPRTRDGSTSAVQFQDPGLPPRLFSKS